MIADIIRFEWRYHTRQISFLAAVALFLGFGFAVSASGFGPDNVHVNSPYSIAQSTGFLSLLSVFVLAVFCANAVVRDRETQMEEIVFTTSVAKLPFLLGRFTGSFLAAFTAFCACVPGMLLGRLMPWHEADRLGSITPWPYLWALLVIALPNLLFAATVLFALSTITRSVLASYAGSVLLYVLYFVGSALTNSPLMAASVPGAQESAWLAAVLDPFALSAFFEQTRHWTPDVRNVRLIALSGHFLANRLLWVGFAGAMLGLVYRVFDFRVTSKGRGAAGAADEERIVATGRTKAAVTPSNWLAYRTATKIEIRSFLLTVPFLAILVLWIALAIVELVNDINGGEYGAASYPASGMLFDTLLQPLTLITTMLIVYVSAEIIWRERTLRFSGILHATPASNGVFVAAKCTALAVLIGSITLTGLLSIATVQLLRGWTIQPAVLLAFAYYAAAPLLILAFIAVFVQTLTPQKYFGMLLVLFVALLGQLGPYLGLEHPLLRFGTPPEVRYSDLNGFDRHAPFHWYVVYWGAIGGLLLSFAMTAWRDGRLRFTRAAIPLLLIAIGSGAFIAFGEPYETADDVYAWRADYEKAYKPLTTLPQPRITALKSQMDLYPEERRYRVRGEYVLLNDTSRPIRTVTIGVRSDASSANVRCALAKSISHDERFNHFTLQFRQPLQPGARTRVQFDVQYTNPGQSIVGNGSYIMSFRAFPSIGYRASYEIQDPRERKRRDLPPIRAAVESRERLPHDEIPSTDWLDFDMTVSTSGDQTAIAPGRVVRTWEQNGRRYSHFRSDTPIPNQFAVSSGRFAIRRAVQDGVAIEVYYHPEHTQNVDAILQASRETLRYCIGNFGPYRHPHLRIVEVPSQFTGFSGFAQPGVIFLGEHRGFLIDGRDERRVDLLYRRVAHEVAHQWWGHDLTPASQPGSALLVESLAKYTELMTLERARGREEVRQLLTHELDLYLSGRADASKPEPPLTRVDNEAFIYYRKGAIVFYALRDLLGEANVNAALRNLLHEHGGARRRPTAAHLVQQLQAVARADQHALIDKWLNEIVLYDFRIESAQWQRRAGGFYDVTLRVGAEMPMPERIDVGIYSGGDEPLHFAKHALHRGEQELRLTVNGEPASVAIDPYVLRVDANRFDNVSGIAPRR